MGMGAFLRCFFHSLAALISCISFLFSILLAALHASPHRSVTKLPETETGPPGVVASGL